MSVVIHTGFLMICSAFIVVFAGAGDTHEEIVAVIHHSPYEPGEPVHCSFEATGCAGSFCTTP